MYNPKKLALERIEILFKEAESNLKKHPERSHKYVKLARKIAMKFNLRIPHQLKRKFCKHCCKYLKPGVNSKVRIHKSRIIIYCKECRKYTRIPLKIKK
ncbi:MAG TPA: ribonuclease P [Candidatus Nanoarchaeia archaeon]|nr:ribonuclease P [Candidatus Nanoarchaeia archaeon]